MRPLLRIIVQRSIQFENEFCCDTDKISNVAPNGHLTPKFGADAAIPQIPPEDAFGKRHVPTQTPGARELISAAPLDHRDMMLKLEQRGKSPHPSCHRPPHMAAGFNSRARSPSPARGRRWTAEPAG